MTTVDRKPGGRPRDRPMPISSTWRRLRRARGPGRRAGRRTFGRTGSRSTTARRPAGWSSAATRSISCRCSSRTTPSTRPGGSKAWTMGRPWSSTTLPGSVQAGDPRRQGETLAPVGRRPGSRRPASPRRSGAPASTGPSFGAGAAGLGTLGLLSAASLAVTFGRAVVSAAPARRRGSRRAWPGWTAGTGPVTRPHAPAERGAHARSTQLDARENAGLSSAEFRASEAAT